MPDKSIKAAALAYNSQLQDSPKVLATGVGEIAKQIIAKAKEFQIPIFSNPILADSLTKIQIDECIPEELYQSVVEVFIWLQNTQNSSQLSQSL